MRRWYGRSKTADRITVSKGGASHGAPPVFYARDKSCVRGDLADAQEAYEAAQEALTDPNATPEQRAALAQNAMDHADWARYRLDDFNAAGREATQAREALTDIIEDLRPYAAGDDPFAVVSHVLDDRHSQAAYVGAIPGAWDHSLTSGKRGTSPLSALDQELDELTASQAELYFRDWTESIGADSAIKSLAEYYDIRYNDPARYALFDQYVKDVQTGWISPLATFENYEYLHGRVETELVGKTTQSGIEITGQVPHFMQRVLGTGTDPQKLREELRIIRRSGVEFEDIESALFSPARVGPLQFNGNGKPSVVHFGEACAVSINPNTGELIQVNPIKRR